MRKRSIVFVLTGALTFGNMHLVFAQSFEGREAEMNQKCSVVKDSATLNECKEYKAYLEEKASNIDDTIANIKNQANNIQGDIEKLVAATNENTQKIKQYNEDIITVQANIDAIQANIVDLNVQIEKKTEEIKERDELMKARLVERQAYLGSNNYIDFIMGSTGFADLLRRTQIVSELNTYENDQIKEVAKEREQLSEDKKVVKLQEELLEVQKKDIDSKIAIAEALVESNDSLIATYHRDQASLNAQKIEAEMASNSIKASLPTISTTIPPELGGDTGNSGTTEDDGNNGDTSDGGSGGSGSNLSSYLQVPMSRSAWSYFSGTWSYPGGGLHLGMDMSTGYSTRIPIYAPATGIVLTTYSGCPEYGGIGNTCGLAWAGNAVLMAVQLSNGESYIIGLYHMYAPSVSPGAVVYQGQQVGLSGSSGNSSGPHCHVEMTYMGNKSLQEIVNIWNANKDVSFGLGWSRANACGSAPCRVRPENFFL